MKKCYMCLISESEAVLYEGIHKNEGIVSVCRKCYHKNKFPLIEKKNIRWEEVDERKSMRERFNKIPIERFNHKEEQKLMKQNLEDIKLKDLVEQNFKREISEGPIKAEDLIDNFNWVITRKRRGLKITREELANFVFEPTLVIESLENGILPRDYIGLIKKVEAYLGVRLFKEKKLGHQDIVSESRVPSGILMSELKREYEKKEIEPREYSRRELFSRPSVETSNEDYVDANEISLEKIQEVSGIPGESFPKKEVRKKPIDELSEEDIEKLIWGK